MENFDVRAAVARSAGLPRCASLAVILSLAVWATLPASGTLYTVCSSGCNTTSIQGFLNANSLSPGDILEVQAATPGGTAVYQEMVVPAANHSGTSNQPVTIRARAGDTIIIDAQLTRSYGFQLDAANYLVVQGFIITNTVSYCIRNMHNIGITIRSNTCYEVFTGSPTSSTKDAIVLLGCVGAVAEYNTIKTESAPYEAPDDTDGIDSADSDGTIIRYNNITINTTTTDQPNQHNDGIQCWSVTNLTIYGNRISMPVPKDYQQGIYVEYYNKGIPATDYGTTLVYNNDLAVMGGSFVMHFDQHALNGTNAIARQRIYNNTIDALNQNSSFPFRQTYDGTYQTGDCSIVLSNNILIMRQSSYAYALIFGGGAQPVTSDYNIIYVPNGPTSQGVVFYGNNQYTLSQWTALGYDTHSIGPSTSPLLGFMHWPQTNSPALGKAASLSGVFTTDALRRNRTVPWDIGAFQASGYSKANPFLIPGGLRIEAIK